MQTGMCSWNRCTERVFRITKTEFVSDNKTKKIHFSENIEVLFIQDARYECKKNEFSFSKKNSRKGYARIQNYISNICA